MARKIDAEKLRWLKEELAGLKEAGVVDEATAGKIDVYYDLLAEKNAVLTSVPPDQAEDAPASPPRDAHLSTSKEFLPQARTHNYSQIILVSLGALLIGAGVILFFAYNWDMMSPMMRLVVGFMPVTAGAICGIYTITREKDARWREFSAFSCASGFAVATAIVSQVYHTGGTLLDFTVLIMIVVLPLIYIFQAQLLTAVYCQGILYCFLDYEVRYAVLDWGLIFTAAVAPWLFYNLFRRRPRGMNTVLARYLAMALLVGFTFHVDHGGSFPFFAAACTLYIAGIYYSEKESVNGFANPWLSFGWLFYTGSLLYFGLWRIPLSFGNLGTTPYWSLPLVLGLFLAYRGRVVLQAIVALTPCLFVILSIISMMDTAPRMMDSAASNLFLALAAFAAFWQGLKNRRIFMINAGMLQILLLAAFRFFDSRISMLFRSLIFIALGIAFISVNVWLGRRFAKERTLAVAEGGNKDAE